MTTFHQVVDVDELLKSYLLQCYFAPCILAICVDRINHAVLLRDKLIALNETVPHWIAPTIHRYDHQRIEFNNGARIVFMHSTDMGRGMRLGRVAIWNESEHVNDYIKHLAPAVLDYSNKNSIVRFY